MTPSDSGAPPTTQLGGGGSHTPEPAGSKSFLDMQSPNGMSSRAHSKFKYSPHSKSAAAKPSGFDTRPSPAPTKND